MPERNSDGSALRKASAIALQAEDRVHSREMWFARHPRVPYAALAQLNSGDWQRRVTRAYGVHLLRVSDSARPYLPPHSDICDRSEAERRAAEILDMLERFADPLVGRRTVQLPGPDAVLRR